MSDFEKKSASYMFDPSKDNVSSPMQGQSGEDLKIYYGPPIGGQVLAELDVWSRILLALKDGIPKPYDSAAVINKINKFERSRNIDLSEIKKCCPPASDFREAKELKPFIFGILDRVVEISGIENYVEKYRGFNNDKD